MKYIYFKYITFFTRDVMLLLNIQKKVHFFFIKLLYGVFKIYLLKRSTQHLACLESDEKHARPSGPWCYWRNVNQSGGKLHQCCFTVWLVDTWWWMIAFREEKCVYACCANRKPNDATALTMGTVLSITQHGLSRVFCLSHEIEERR